MAERDNIFPTDSRGADQCWNIIGKNYWWYSLGKIAQQWYVKLNIKYLIFNPSSFYDMFDISFTVVMFSEYFLMQNGIIIFF